MAGIDTVNEVQGQNESKRISGSGTAKVIPGSTIEKVDGPDWKNTAELEKFMNEEVEILVYEPIDENEPFLVDPSVNGTRQFIIRGVPQKVKRKYVEVLARSKRNMVSARGYIDRQTQEAVNEVRVNKSLMYPFQILEDPNPNGPAWLRKVLAEG